MARRKKFVINRLQETETKLLREEQPQSGQIEIEPDLDKGQSLDALVWVTELGGILSSMLRNELCLFATFINLASMTAETKKSYCQDFRRYVKCFVESGNTGSLCSKESVAHFSSHLNLSVTAGKIAKSTRKKRRSTIKAIMLKCFSVQAKDFDAWFPLVGKRTSSLYGAKVDDTDNSKGYSKNDFELLLAILVGGAKYYAELHLQRKAVSVLTKQSFVFEHTRGSVTLKHSKLTTLTNPDNYIKNIATTFYMWVFAAVCGISQSAAIRVKRKNLDIEPGESGLLKVYITDRRKKLRESCKPLLAKKHQMGLLMSIIDHSKSVDSSADALLFPYADGEGQHGGILSSFISSLQYNLFRRTKIIGEYGEVLIPAGRKLRQSYGMYFDDVKSKSVALGNKPRTSGANYNFGNKLENNEILQEGMEAYEQSLRSNIELHETVASMRVKVSSEAQAEESLQKPGATKTPCGGVCMNSTSSSEAKRYARKRKKAGMVKEGELLHCSNFLACITCSNHMLVDSADRFYELLSLKQYLTDSQYESESGGLFGERKAIESTIAGIDLLAKYKFDPVTVDKARQILEFEGVSPLWLLEI